MGSARSKTVAARVPLLCEMMVPVPVLVWLLAGLLAHLVGPLTLAALLLLSVLLHPARPIKNMASAVATASLLCFRCMDACLS
jgi:hypothetical protein